MNTTINGSLPVIIEIIKKTSFNRYEIKFGTKSLSTKSATSLIVGAKYWANVGYSDSGVININTLLKKDEIPFLEQGSELINRLLSGENLGFFSLFLKKSLAKTTNKAEFETLSNMLIALQHKVVEIPFFDGKNLGLSQFKFQNDTIIFYLIYDIFPPIIFEINSGKITKIRSIYRTLVNKLALKFECSGEVENVQKLFQNSKNLVDFKG